MPNFDSNVSPPSPASYAPAPLNFSQVANWAADDPYKKIFDRQQQQLNQQRLQAGQQPLDLAKSLQGVVLSVFESPCPKLNWRVS